MSTKEIDKQFVFANEDWFNIAGIIERDNSIEDDSSQYLSELTYPKEKEALLDVQLNWWNYKKSVASAIGWCKRRNEMTWNSVFNQWHSIHDQNGDIETALCCHIDDIQTDLNSSIDKGVYDSLLFYHVFLISWRKVSKRLGRNILISKVYCYCPICRKLYCIGGRKIEQGLFNLIDLTSLGRIIKKEINHKYSKYPYRMGFCYQIWGEQKQMFEKYNVVWYNPTALTGTLYD